jgi:hypothetical protein
MINENDAIDNVFERLKGGWDIEEPTAGHHDRFLERLHNKKSQRKAIFRFILPVAAILLILMGVFKTYNQQDEDTNPLAKVSPQLNETQMYFAAVIEKELTKVERENSPETRKLVKDALYHMQQLEKDYEKLTKELLKNGENKKIIHAMITNLQTRVSFLEEVLTRIENTKKLKEQYNDNNQI